MSTHDKAIFLSLLSTCLSMFEKNWIFWTAISFLWAMLFPRLSVVSSPTALLSLLGCVHMRVYTYTVLCPLCVCGGGMYLFFPQFRTKLQLIIIAVAAPSTTQFNNITTDDKMTNHLLLLYLMAANYEWLYGSCKTVKKSFLWTKLVKKKFVILLLFFFIFFLYFSSYFLPTWNY